MYSQVDDTLSNHDQSSLLKFYFVNGYGVIYQPYLTKKSVFRFHLNIDSDGYDSNENRNSIVYRQTPPNEIHSIAISETSWEIQISPEYCFSILSKNHITLYAGFGPLFTYGYSNRTVKEIISDFYTYRYDISNKFSFGLICLLGVESKLTDFIYIFSEIDIKGGKSWYNYDSQVEQGYIPSINYRQSIEISKPEWFYELSKIKIGVSFLF